MSSARWKIIIIVNDLFSMFLFALSKLSTLRPFFRYFLLRKSYYSVQADIYFFANENWSNRSAHKHIIYDQNVEQDPPFKNDSLQFIYDYYIIHTQREKAYKFIIISFSNEQ